MIKNNLSRHDMNRILEKKLQVSFIIEKAQIKTYLKFIN